MHTWYYRLNGLFTVATTVLACMCALASLTEILHRNSPVLDVTVHSIDALAVRFMTSIVYSHMFSYCQQFHSWKSMDPTWMP